MSMSVKFCWADVGFIAALLHVAARQRRSSTHVHVRVRVRPQL
jgi:hypothetical protein